MKLIIFKKTTFKSKNIDSYDSPKSITQISFLGIVLYKSKEFITESNSDII